MQFYDKNAKKILSGAAWLGISAIILKLIGLIYKIPMSYLLGDEGMGYFNSAYTVYTFFYIIGSAGIPKAISILCAKSSAEEAKSIFLSMFRIYIFISLILSGVLLFSSGWLARIISSKNSSFAILAISPSVFFVSCSGVLRGYLNGKTKFVPVAISELIGGLCKLVLGLVFAFLSIKSGFELPFVCAFSILGITFGSLFGFLYLYVYYKRESKDIKREYLKSNKIIKDVFKIGLPIAFAAALSNFVNIIDLSVIMNRLKSSGYSESVSAVIYGNYTTLAVPVFSLVTNVLNTVSLAALPIITKSFSERKYRELTSSLDSSLQLSLFIACPAFFMFSFFPLEILSAIFESASATLGAAFLLSLSPGIIFYSLLMSLNTVLEGTGKIKSAVASLSLGALLKCVLSFALIGTDSFGALGAPISTSASYVFSFLISFIIMNMDKKIKFPIFKSLKYPMLASVIALIPVLFIRRPFFKNGINRVNSFIILIIYGIFYIIFSLFLTIIRKNKAKLSAKCTKNKVFDY